MYKIHQNMEDLHIAQHLNILDFYLIKSYR